MGRKAKNDANGESSSGRPEQQFIPGTEPKRIPEIDELALKYRDVRDQRMDLTEQEESLQKQLSELLKQHGFKEGGVGYRISNTDPPLVANIAITEAKAKVRKWDPKRDAIAAEPPPDGANVKTTDEEAQQVNEAIDQVAAGSAS